MDLEKHIKDHEGLKLKLYACPAGKLTIGYGRNIEDKGISIFEAEYLLKQDIYEAKLELSEVFGESVKGFTINRYNALVDMMFNMGLPTFLEFKSMIQAIKNSDWDTAAREALNSLWAKQVGKRAEIDAFNLKVG